MRFSLALAVAIPLALITQPPLLPAGENYALLVGVGDYDVKELRPLKFTRADVLALHARLLESGFDAKNVVLMHDDLKGLVAHYEELGPPHRPLDYVPQADNIRREMKLLLGRLRRDDSVVVAFSGHGVQFRGEQASYFCPADAKLEEKDSLIAFADVFAALKGSAASRRLFLVDACQNDPLSGLAKSRDTINLESITRPQETSVPEGIIALFSCRAGQKSFEMPELGHGVFFHHLLEAWDGKGDLNDDGKLSYQELTNYTQRRTAEYAALHLKVLQTPQLKAEFSGEWVLRELKQLPPLFDFTDEARSAKEAQASQAEWAKALGTKVVETNSLGMKLALIPPGEFLMGSPESEQRRDDEELQHRVRITQPFRLGTTEVTQEQWKAVMGTEPWKGRNYVREGADYPASYVKWRDASEFCRKLSAKEKTTYRLPTEAEWEYACRAGTITSHYFGDNIEENFDYAWSRSNTWLRGRHHPHEVGRKRANAFGLYDMAGNLYEFCADWYAKDYYSNSPENDPTGPPKRRGSDHVMRGGCFNFEAFLRSAKRATAVLDGGYMEHGFRVVRGG